MAAQTPAALDPYIVQHGLNDPIVIANGPFQLTAFGQPSIAGQLQTDPEVRNALVHSTERKRIKLAGVSGVQLLECAQLAREYVELTLLAMFGYRGQYRRRAWRGDAVSAETNVPWL